MFFYLVGNWHNEAFQEIEEEDSSDDFMARAKPYKEKLSQLGYTTGRNSYWLANVARLLDAILTPGQRIERDLSYVSSCDRKNDLLPILQNVTVTDTRHRHS